MKRHRATALALLGWSLSFATREGTQGSAISDSGIRGIAGCTPTFGNAPAGDPTWPCGRIIDANTGKDIGEVTCHVLSQGFSIALPPGKYIVNLRAGDETRTASVVVEEHKWTDIEPWSKSVGLLQDLLLSPTELSHFTFQKDATRYDVEPKDASTAICDPDCIGIGL